MIPSNYQIKKAERTTNAFRNIMDGKSGTESFEECVELVQDIEKEVLVICIQFLLLYSQRRYSIKFTSKSELINVLKDIKDEIKDISAELATLRAK